MDEVMSRDYFANVFRHLYEFSWIYDFNNTKVFSDSILDNIPIEWQQSLLNLTTEELNDIPYGLTKIEWPKSLIKFLQYSLALSTPRHRCLEEISNVHAIDIPDSIKRGMSPKKLMEVKYLSALVRKLCAESGCTTVLDIGCGLGYLDQVLHHNFGYRIIGVDSEAKKCQGAIKRTKIICSKNIHYCTMQINENSCTKLQNLLSSIPPYSPCKCGNKRETIDIEEKGILMLSLHSCGDLTPNMLKLYIDIPNILGIVNVGCCYHIMKKDKTDTHFINFPLSQTVKLAYEDTIQKYSTWKVSSYGFRLAAQETREHWKKLSTEEHKNHSKFAAYRAMLQVYVDRNEIIWRKSRRRLARKKQITSFDEYIETALNNIHSEVSTRQKAVIQLNSIFEEFFPKIKIIEVLTLLQVLLQPLWEIILVYDRCIYLQESGVEVKMVTIGDEAISPRNLAITARKV